MNYADFVSNQAKTGKPVELTPKFVKWTTADQTIIGRYLAKIETIGKRANSAYYQYLFDTDGGRVKFSLGAVTDKQIADALTVGNVYKITFLGKLALEGGTAVNQFDVQDFGAPPPTAEDEIPF